MRDWLFVVFALSVVETATCQIPNVECYKYNLQTTGKDASVFGEAFYEFKGTRFLYRVSLAENVGDLPIKLTCGFDGNEYWFASYGSFHTQFATSVARYESENSLSIEFPRLYFERFYRFKSGREYLYQVAICEFVDTVCFPESRIKTRGEIERNIRAQDNVTLVSNQDQGSFGHSDFFNFANLNFEIVSARIGHQTRNFLVQVDNDENFPIAKIRAILPGGVWTGPIPPGYPLPRTFEMMRVGKAELSPIEFLPQFYSNTETELLTFGNERKKSPRLDD